MQRMWKFLSPQLSQGAFGRSFTKFQIPQFVLRSEDDQTRTEWEIDHAVAAELKLVPPGFQFHAFGGGRFAARFYWRS